MQLEPTGERMVEAHYANTAGEHLIYVLHVATYNFAARYAEGKRVLDYGCGSGYGSAQIARHAFRVAGVDVSRDAVEHASAAYPLENLDFSVIDPKEPLPFPEHSFDVVLSFQVFEHVREPLRYLQEVRRVLAPGGMLILATPDRGTRLLPFQRPWNRWHVHEYERRELANLLRGTFDEVEVMGMTAPKSIIGMELQRTRRLKWLSLPFTLPIMPDKWRVRALGAIRNSMPSSPPTTVRTDFGFDASDIQIRPDARPSVNLVALAR